MVTIFNPETFSKSSSRHTETKNMQKATLIFILLSFAVIVAVMINSLTIDNNKTYAMDYQTETVEPMYISTYYEGNIIYSEPATETQTEQVTETSQATTTSSEATTTTSETTTSATTTTTSETTTQELEAQVVELEAEPVIEQPVVEVIDETTEAPTTSASETVITTTATAPSNGDLTYSSRSVNYTYEEYEMLCAVVMHEVGYCSEYSQQLVTSLILNRVVDGRFGNNIYEVLHAPGQFTAINNYYYPTVPVTDSVRAVVKQVLNSNVDYANGALFYYAPRWSGYSSFFENRPFVMEYEGQRFFK